MNNMMEETEAELDEAILECTEYDRHTVAILDENTRLRKARKVAKARTEAYLAAGALFIASRMMSSRSPESCFRSEEGRWPLRSATLSGVTWLVVPS